jgi:hypothetical protein
LYSKGESRLAPLDFASGRKEEETIRSYRVDRFILYPLHWNNYPNMIPLTWNKVKFTESNASYIPDDQAGVYSFVADAGIAQHPAGSYLLYIGKAEKQNLRKRYYQYLQARNAWKQRPHIAQMIDKWSDYLWFYYAEVTDTTKISQLEEDLITAFLPPQNREWPATITHVMRMVFS